MIVDVLSLHFINKMIAKINNGIESKITPVSHVVPSILVINCIVSISSSVNITKGSIKHATSAKIVRIFETFVFFLK